MSSKPKIHLPEGADPNDQTLKAAFHPNADDKNIIDTSRKNPMLVCGAVKKGKLCRQPAGMGTSHIGYGRCKFHGGASTGPKTEAGKARTSQNARTHGIFSKALLPEELELFNELVATPVIDLKNEIALQRTKILSYLQRNREKFEADREAYGDEKAYAMSKVYYSESESGARSFYHAGTIEDRALDRALARLRHLVETQNRLDVANEDDNILDFINSELRAASQGLVNISWGGEAQHKIEDST